jgi:hypothetical protein
LRGSAVEGEETAHEKDKDTDLGGGNPSAPEFPENAFLPLGNNFEKRETISYG